MILSQFHHISVKIFLIIHFMCDLNYPKHKNMHQYIFIMFQIHIMYLDNTYMYMFINYKVF